MFTSLIAQYCHAVFLSKNIKSLLNLQLLSACTAGMASAMQGAVYALPTRAIPLLTQEEDPDMRLSPQAASWFGNHFNDSTLHFFKWANPALFLFIFVIFS